MQWLGFRGSGLEGIGHRGLIFTVGFVDVVFFGLRLRLAQDPRLQRRLRKLELGATDVSVYAPW